MTSDYLWDGTGAVDEDVRALEEKLSTLRYRPSARPLLRRQKLPLRGVAIGWACELPAKGSSRNAVGPKGSTRRGSQRVRRNPQALELRHLHHCFQAAVQQRGALDLEQASCSTRPAHAAIPMHRSSREKCRR